mgnify:CR=1 FL=1
MHAACGPRNQTLGRLAAICADVAVMVHCNILPDLQQTVQLFDVIEAICNAESSGRYQQRLMASSPSPSARTEKPAFCKRVATSRGRSRPLVRRLGLPV